MSPTTPEIRPTPENPARDQPAPNPRASERTAPEPAAEAPGAVRARGLCKRYKIFPSNRARLLEAAAPFLGRRHREFWALRGVDLDIAPGRTVGILGRNGSGKSTLLQLIAGVLSPTSGRVSRAGRVSALLELGAGFNPEFTGRDNVIINGAVMGFNRAEMEERLPRIVDFSELGEFVDQPVRTYSSGMYLRLAFAASILVDPDILIVDEALAVGDAKFQTKCYRQFDEFKRAGKTILFVSHDNGAIVRYCDEAVLMDDGRVVFQGEPRAAVNHYAELLHGGGPAAPRPAVRSAGGGGADADARAGADAGAAGGGAGPDGAADEVAHVGHSGGGASPFDAFLRARGAADRCPARRCYNPHEHRYGTRGAEIVDALVLRGEEADPAAVRSGDVVDLYVKARFHRAVARPIYGLMVKSLNGTLCYGTNSELEGAPAAARAAGEDAVVHFSLPLRLIAADYFLTVGVAERPEGGGEPEPLDRRQDLLHLTVQAAGPGFGLVDLRARACETAVLVPPPPVESPA